MTLNGTSTFTGSCSKTGLEHASAFASQAMSSVYKDPLQTMDDMHSWCCNSRECERTSGSRQVSTESAESLLHLLNIMGYANNVAVWAGMMLVVLLSAASARADPLELITAGLTASGLCPLVKSHPQAVIDAIATRATQAYDQGTQDRFAAALGAAVGAANDNGCINEVFEGVDQAIIKGGFKVEAVVGKALAIGVASGTAGTGDVLAKATAVVICKGGESASACARAWAQAIKIDPKNGCAVLETAYVYARAFCSEGVAKTQVQSTFFVQPLGQCGQPDFASGGSSNGDTSSNGGGSSNRGSNSNGVSVSVNQGSSGQDLTFPGGSVVQGSGGERISFPYGSVTLGPAGISWGGRKMFAVVSVANAAATNTGIVNNGQITANALSTASGGGDANVLSQANAAATNTGILNGGSITANAASNAVGMPSWMLGGGKLLKRLLAVVSVANASATNTGVVNGGSVTANALSTAQGFGSEDVSGQANAAATNTGVLNGGSITSNAVSNAMRTMPPWMTGHRKV